MRKFLVLAALLGSALIAPAAHADPVTHVVDIRDFAYKPDSLTIAVGDTVKFVNHDDVGHTVTAKDASFDSKNLDTGKSWSYTFTTAGTYPYLCTVHPSMQATITAQ
ncbi:MAG TPA: cupredoxin family copper-binding protein [Candidatus Baltobacteraceae bacterium]|jgi:plastocyanin|nr:cupredoxin family copper-binding protein [Candidatus Baltobacteraceae bacterium]